MIRIAICHADKDQQHLAHLKTLLAEAERDGEIEIWDRSKIPPGATTTTVVEQRLKEANVIVLLHSPDLVASHAAEIDLALRQRGAHVIPVLVRPALLAKRISELNVLPRDKVPVTRQPDKDDAWAAIATELLAVSAHPAPPPQAQQQQQQPRQAQQNPTVSGEIKILFMGANPSGTTRLALDAEVKEISDRIKSAQKRDRLPIAQEHAVPLHELQQILLHHEPTILHFSGHGTTDGKLVFLSRSGTGAPAPPEAIANLLAFCVEDGLRCVVLNACYAEEQARLIAEHVECVVGISGEIKDKSAIEFSAGFYAGLAESRTVQRAFDLGKNQIKLMGEPHADRLRLHCKPGVDPRTLKLV